MSRFVLVIRYLIFYSICLQFFLVTALLELNVYDDGIILSGAYQLIAGNKLYQDYWTLYSPAQFYIIAFLLKIFGVNAFLLKVFGVVVKACLAIIFFSFIQIYTDRIYAFLATLTLLPLLAFFSFDAFPVLPALAFILASLFVLQGGYSNKRFFISGILLAFAGCFRHDLAVYTFAGICLSFIAVKTEGELLASCRQQVWRQCFSFVLGAAVLTLPVLAFLLHEADWILLYQSFVQDPALVYAPNRQLPWPGILSGMDASVYFPYALSVVVFVLLGSKSQVDLKRGLILLCVVMLFLSLKGWVRTGFYHMVQAIIPALILFFVMLYAQWLRKNMVVVAVLVLMWGAFMLPVYKQAFPFAWRQTVQNIEEGFGRCWSKAEQPAGCLRLDKDYSQAIDWLEEHTQAGDCIYIGPGRHDKVFVNAVAGYFLAQRLPCTRWAETHPGLQTRLDIQQAMREEMINNPPAALLLDSRWDGVREPNASSQSSQVSVLDQWIKHNYHVVARFGSIQMWQPYEKLDSKERSNAI